MASENGLVEVSLLEGPERGYAPYVISDEMAETRHMASGKYFTSKKKFRDETRAYGCVEVGNETATLLKPRQPAKLDRRARREAIKAAIRNLT